ncbi:uncharacterized protein LOC120346958 [Styela clava]
MDSILKMMTCQSSIWILLAIMINVNEAYQCPSCPKITLGTENKNITYGPSNERDCQCDWTIPTSMATDHETAVVLLLQNVSLPMTAGSGSRDCSGEIRFPGASGHRCDFANYQCIVYTTESTICNINIIREKIPVANHTCNSIIPWNNAGGSPYKIQYYSRGYVGYTKYFTIQYLVVDCRSPTTTFKPSTGNGWETTTKNPIEISTTEKTERTTKNKITEAEQRTTQSDSGITNSHSICDLDKNITITTGINGSSDSLMIAIPVSGIVGFIFGALSMSFIQRYCNKNKKKLKNKDSMEMGSIQHPEPTVHKRTTYENYTPTSDESGYEVPNQVDNKNEQSGYEVPNQVDNKNEQSGYEVPIQVDNKNEQQYEVMTTGKEYEYEN